MQPLVLRASAAGSLAAMPLLRHVSGYTRQSVDKVTVGIETNNLTLFTPFSVDQC
jgi:hypothetical protein